jgi:hypothetical protein
VAEFHISRSVGKRGVNRQIDQYNIIDALNLVPADDGGPPEQIIINVKDRVVDERLVAAILRFQQKNIDLKYADGRVDPDKRTIRKLNEIIALPRPNKPPSKPPIVPTDPTRVRVQTAIKVMQQPMVNGCWATLTTMILKARNPNVVSDALPPMEQVNTALGTLPDGTRWQKIFAADTGLNNRHLASYFEDEIKLTRFFPEGGFHEKRKFKGAKAWMLMLRTVNRPIFVSTFRFDATVTANHVITLVGIDSAKVTANKFANVTEPGDGTAFVLDTNGGIEKQISVADLDFIMSDDGPAGDDSTQIQRNRARLWY